MDAFDVLQSVFGTLVVPQTVIDEIKNLRDEQETPAGRSMTMTWHNGEYIRQDHTAEDIAARRGYIVEQLKRIEAACEVRPVVAPDHPREVATVITQTFGSYVLDAANLAGTDYILVSKDMYYRQFAEAACAAKGLWLQPIFSFAHETGAIDAGRYVDLVVKLAWRRHGHLSLNVATMFVVLRGDPKNGLENFRAIANFIGTRNADLRSHIEVTITFSTSFGASPIDLICAACKRRAFFLSASFVSDRKTWRSFLHSSSAAVLLTCVNTSTDGSPAISFPLER